VSSFDFDAIGTRWAIESAAPLQSEMQRCILARIEAFDAVWSRFRSDSIVQQIARALDGGVFVFPDEAVDLFALYDALHCATDGAVDPLVGRDLVRLGYDAGYSLTPAMFTCDEERLDWSRDIVRDGAKLLTRRPLVVDVGAAGKGLLVDIVIAMLIDSGVDAAIVDAGGDMRRIGRDPVRVGLEHPFDARLAIGSVELGDGALCASAVGRRAWGNGLHHVVDGRTGRPTRDVVATWVVADTAMVADGLATALFFAPADHLTDRFSFSYARMFADGRAEMSAGFVGELFIA